ncbi:hypothetical protein BDV95DRAFT_673127 [Massariosphaeria phaeospora]|uniref:STB6-like N-terminal domain-containing protein n=1 Tax=Massariosphaeria phaeospora TaxID=100035 RepID=A0A7C8MAX7_9PLEO|nr:hypothetical protein BDV95DRAFT_673127 [Massariosphaeria phaeospora]
MASTLPTSLSARHDAEQELRRRMPRLQTSPTDSKSTSTTAATRTEQMKSPISHANSPVESSAKSATPGNHQRFVLTDPVAFRYLEEDPGTTVLSRREKLQGYEVYLVEQWACSRAHPTFVITTYTGDPKDSLWASIISVPTDESVWSPQMRLYFGALDQYHARRKETDLGTLMITNLSGFPSSLTVIPVPEGDVRKYRELFFVNENLKRLGCSGRLGIKLAPPSSATQAKFHQLYRTSDKIPLNSSVIELVKLCQVALVVFGKLEPEYADGLLCDVTETAINDWWIEFGAEHYMVEPHDGILGPTTVSALLGMLMGARNRLSAYNAPVAKDVFDIESTKRGIAYFQKSQRLQKTRRLDRPTLESLSRATAKAASKEGWGMPRALKTTVAELGGKGGEMVMGMVGAGDKAGIAEIETVDLDRFVELVQGERSKWLWHGKPRKSTNDMFSRLPGEEGSQSAEDIAHKLLKRESTLESHGLSKRGSNTDETKRFSDGFRIVEGSEKDKDPNSKRAAIKRATGKIESGSGLSRIKDVVGRRGHQPKPSKDESGRVSTQQLIVDSVYTRHRDENGTSVSGSHDRPRFSQEQTRDALSTVATHQSGTNHDPSFTKTLTETPRGSNTSLAIEKAPSDHAERNAIPKHSTDEEDPARPPTIEDSVAGSIYHGIDLNDKLPVEETNVIPPFLRRTQSSDQLEFHHALHRSEKWWPRNLSFSIAEESILTWRSLTIISPEEDSTASLRAALASQQLIAEDAKRLRHRLALLYNIDARWVEARLTSVQDLETQADQDITELDDMYYPRLDEYQSLREDAHEILSRERLQLQEAIRDLETLGAKLEYEIHALRSKVDDVEDGVQELERQVEFVEEKCRELDVVCAEREGWLHWGVRVLTGMGRPPG